MNVLIMLVKNSGMAPETAINVAAATSYRETLLELFLKAFRGLQKLTTHGSNFEVLADALDCGQEVVVAHDSQECEKVKRCKDVQHYRSVLSLLSWNLLFRR